MKKMSNIYWLCCITVIILAPITLFWGENKYLVKVPEEIYDPTTLAIHSLHTSSILQAAEAWQIVFLFAALYLVFTAGMAILLFDVLPVKRVYGWLLVFLAVLLVLLPNVWMRLANSTASDHVLEQLLRRKDLFEERTSALERDRGYAKLPTQEELLSMFIYDPPWKRSILDLVDNELARSEFHDTQKAAYFQGDYLDSLLGWCPRGQEVKEKIRSYIWRFSDRIDDLVHLVDAVVDSAMKMDLKDDESWLYLLGARVRLLVRESNNAPAHFEDYRGLAEYFLQLARGNRYEFLWEECGYMSLQIACRASVLPALQTTFQSDHLEFERALWTHVIYPRIYENHESYIPRWRYSVRHHEWVSQVPVSIELGRHLITNGLFECMIDLSQEESDADPLMLFLETEDRYLIRLYAIAHAKDTAAVSLVLSRLSRSGDADLRRLRWVILADLGYFQRMIEEGEAEGSHFARALAARAMDQPESFMDLKRMVWEKEANPSEFFNSMGEYLLQFEDSTAVRLAMRDFDNATAFWISSYGGVFGFGANVNPEARRMKYLKNLARAYEQGNLSRQ